MFGGMKDLREMMLDDLFAFGICASKTEIVDGKVSIKYIDPMSDELQMVMYNAEHSDSQMTINVFEPNDPILPMPKRRKHQKPTNNS